MPASDLPDDARLRLKAYKIAWAEKNKARIFEQRKSYREKNKQALKAEKAADYQKHKAKRSATAKKWRERNRADLLVKDRNRYRNNREVASQKKKAHYATNRSRIPSERKAKYAASREEMISKRREYNSKNRQIIRLAKRTYANLHPGKVKQWKRNDLNNNRPRHTAASAKRRARKRNAAIGHDQAAVKRFYKLVAEATRITCYWCGKVVPKGNRNVDHIIPITKGGAHEVSNLAASCQFCNYSKHDKLPHEVDGQHLISFAAITA